MPSSSKRQARTMAAAAHSAKFAKKVGIPQSVAKEFNQADTGSGLLRGPKTTSMPTPYAKKGKK